MMNLDDFQAEHEAEKAAKAAAEAAAKAAQEAKEMAELQAQRAAEFKKRANAMWVYRQRIAAAIAELKPEWSTLITPDTFEFKVEGRDMSSYLTFEPEYYAKYGRSHWKPTGRTSITVGVYGDRQRYPQRKDGNHKYEAIAQYLVGKVIARQLDEQLQARRQANANAAAAVIQEFSLSTWSVVEPSGNLDAPVTVDLDRLYNRKVNLTADQARALLTALKAAGFRP